jgi:hypothetical protein
MLQEWDHGQADQNGDEQRTQRIGNVPAKL